MPRRPAAEGADCFRVQVSIPGEDAVLRREHVVRLRDLLTSLLGEDT